ncbi:hypothetical protein VR010_14130 [Actinomycetaceae bacterium L2_0104]
MGLLHKKKEKKPLGKRLSRGFVILVIACLAFLWLAGCSYPGSNAYRHQSGDEEPAPTITLDPTDEDSTPAEDTTGDGETEKPSSASDALNIEPESGTAYLHAEQAFSPLLERWVVDGSAMHYTRWNCTGEVQADVSGSISVSTKNDGQEIHEVTWNGENPELYTGDAPTTDLLITDDVLIGPYQMDDRRAIADTDTELQTYVTMCGKAGKDLADFVLG